MKANKVILDLCGGTGSWSDPYRKAGYTVHLITWPSYDVRAHRFSNGKLIFEGMGEAPNIEILVDQIHGILAAPPCTQFSRARTTAKTPRDFIGALSVVEACLDIARKCRAYGKLSFWAMENPMGLLRQFLGNPSASFRGWEYGDRHVKFTDLWGYFSMPKGRVKTQPAFDREKWAASKKPAKYADRRMSRADVRAITPAKFALAFCKKNP